MSSDGIRKQTLSLGWDISASGGMSRPGGGVVVVDDVQPVSGAIPIESGAIIIDKPPALPAAVAKPAQPSERQRRSTLDTFNDEMAILERPIEGDVEYVDDKPPTRWKHLAAFIATVAIVGGGGAFMIKRHRAAVAARNEPSPPAAVMVASAAPSPARAAAPAPAPAARPAAAPAAAAAAATATAPADDDSADDDAAEAPPAAQSAWSKVKSGAPHGAHAKHARSVAKSSHHRSKHAAAPKRSSRH
jgi:hypothetical protein